MRVGTQPPLDKEVQGRREPARGRSVRERPDVTRMVVHSGSLSAVPRAAARLGGPEKAVCLSSPRRHQGCGTGSGGPQGAGCPVREVGRSWDGVVSIVRIVEEIQPRGALVVYARGGDSPGWWRRAASVENGALKVRFPEAHISMTFSLSRGGWLDGALERRWRIHRATLRKVRD